MMEKDKDPTKVNPKRSAGPQGRSANVETNIEARSKVVFRDPADFSGEGTFKFPGVASESRPRPQRNIPANIPRVQINVGSKSRRKDSTTTTPAPNYQVIQEVEVLTRKNTFDKADTFVLQQVVVGLSYDDEDERGTQSADIQVS